MLPPPKNFWKLGLRKRHILHSLNRTQLIHTCILLSFSQSLVTHDSRAEVQRFMIPNFLKQKFMILTCFVAMIHDSWFRFHPRSYYKVDEYLPLKSEKNICTDYTQYCTTLEVHFARQAQLGAHGCQKLFWLIQHSGLTLFVNWALT